MAHPMETRREAIQMLLKTIPGEDYTREGLLDTPDRVARMYEEIFGGYEVDPCEYLKKTFAVDDGYIDEEEIGDIYSRGIVVIKDIPFYSHCEHHMVPFFGSAKVAYIPNERVVGLSKVGRVVEAYSKRLQIQERLTKQICDAMEKTLNPQGVMVIIKAEHLCMSMRGVKKPGSNTVTSHVTGAFAKNPEARREAMELFKM